MGDEMPGVSSGEDNAASSSGRNNHHHHHHHHQDAYAPVGPPTLGAGAVVEDDEECGQGVENATGRNGPDERAGRRSSASASSIDSEADDAASFAPGPSPPKDGCQQGGPNSRPRPSTGSSAGSAGHVQQASEHSPEEKEAAAKILAALMTSSAMFEGAAQVGVDALRDIHKKAIELKEGSSPRNLAILEDIQRIVLNAEHRIDRERDAAMDEADEVEEMLMDENPVFCLSEVHDEAKTKKDEALARKHMEQEEGGGDNQQHGCIEPTPTRRPRGCDADKSAHVTDDEEETTAESEEESSAGGVADCSFNDDDADADNDIESMKEEIGSLKAKLKLAQLEKAKVEKNGKKREWVLREKLAELEKDNRAESIRTAYQAKLEEAEAKAAEKVERAKADAAALARAAVERAAQPAPSNDSGDLSSKDDALSDDPSATCSTSAKASGFDAGKGVGADDTAERGNEATALLRAERARKEAEEKATKLQEQLCRKEKELEEARNRSSDSIEDDVEEVGRGAGGAGSRSPFTPRSRRSLNPNLSGTPSILGPITRRIFSPALQKAMTGLTSALAKNSAEMARFGEDGSCDVEGAISKLRSSSNPFEAMRLPTLLLFARGVEAGNQDLVNLRSVAIDTLIQFFDREDALKLVMKDTAKQLIGLSGPKGNAYDNTARERQASIDKNNVLLLEMREAVGRYLGKSKPATNSELKDELVLGLPAKNVVNICLTILIAVGVMTRVRFADLPEALQKKINKLALEVGSKEYDYDASKSIFDCWQDVISSALGSGTSDTCDVACELMLALADVGKNEKVRAAFNAEAVLPALGDDAGSTQGVFVYSDNDDSKNKAQTQMRIFFSILMSSHMERAIFEDHLGDSEVERFKLLPVLLRCSPTKISENAGALIWKSRNGAVYAFALPGTDLHRRFSVASLCKHLALLVEGSTTKNTESHFRSKLFLLKTAESNTAALSRRNAVSRRYAGTAESDAAIADDDEGEDADTSIDAFCSSAQPMFAGKGI